MKFVFPSMEYKEKAIDYINEFYKYDSEIHGSGYLDRFLKESTYEKWLENILEHVDIANMPEKQVPALTYFYVREEDKKIVGMINLRLSLNDYLRNEGGHIGYSIRPTERRKHYATTMLTEALKIFDIIGTNEILISCKEDNIASMGVIKNCNGVFKQKVHSDCSNCDLDMYIIKR